MLDLNDSAVNEIALIKVGNLPSMRLFISSSLTSSREKMDEF